MGLGFVMDTVVLLPVSILSLVLAVTALGYRARGRYGYGPLIVGIMAAVALILGKFVFDWSVLVFGAVVVLVVASIWNAWPTKSTASDSSPPGGTLLQIGRINEGDENGSKPED